MRLILLTHSRELNKPSNTGQLVQQYFPDTIKIIWQRKQPDDFLMQLINTESTVLVFPCDNPVTESRKVAQFKNYILIDSTWQEARKIFNHSPYLQDLPCIKIKSQQQSVYQLRRNQLEGGLCTAETAIEIFRLNTMAEKADQLTAGLKKFVSLKEIRPEEIRPEEIKKEEIK